MSLNCGKSTKKLDFAAMKMCKAVNYAAKMRSCRAGKSTLQVRLLKLNITC